MSARVLLVDDDELLARSIARPLRLAGYTVILAAHGQEALELLAEEEVDVVLTDVWMPVMDGWTLLRTIKAQQPALPVILFTGLAFPNQEANAREQGAAEFLAKPLRLDRLLEVLERVSARDASEDG